MVRGCRVDRDVEFSEGLAPPLGLAASDASLDVAFSDALPPSSLVSWKTLIRTSSQIRELEVPLSSEYGTYKAVKARFWPWLSG